MKNKNRDNRSMTVIGGLCMACADSVPGVSGGTVAFILGFYERLINALHDLVSGDKEEKLNAVKYLAVWLSGWIPGMILCILVLSNMFEKNIYFMSSLFLGLTFVSIPFIMISEKEALRKNVFNILFTIIGAAAVIGLTLIRNSSGSLTLFDFMNLSLLQYVYVLAVGMIAITAMILPGISGSTVLLIVGIYMPAIEAAKQLLHFNLNALPGVMALGIGILLGICVSIHLIRKALKDHRSEMVYLIIGLMIGSIYAIIMGPATMTRPQPALSLSTFNILGCICGVFALLVLEFLKKVTASKNEAKAFKEADGHEC